MGAVNCRDSNVYKCFSHSTGLPTYKNGEIDALLILPWAHSSSISSGRLRFSQEGKPKPTGVKSCSGGQNRQLGGYHSLSPLHQIHLWTSAVESPKDRRLPGKQCGPKQPMVCLPLGGIRRMGNVEESGESSLSL